MKDNTIMIQGAEVLVKEWHGKRVVTLKDIDMVHRKPEGTAKRYFDQNKQRFIPRVDFYRISANEYRSQFDTAHPKQTSKSVAFITVSGYTLITKQYTTDRDNHVMRDMLMDYFEVTEGY